MSNKDRCVGMATNMVGKRQKQKCSGQIHIGICILPVVFNAGMEATGDIPTAASMTIRVLKSELIPLAAGIVVCDLLVTIGWIGMVIKGMIPVKKWMLICCPVFGIKTNRNR